jgi:hypothetical protein
MKSYTATNTTRKTAAFSKNRSSKAIKAAVVALVVLTIANLRMSFDSAGGSLREIYSETTSALSAFHKSLDSIVKQSNQVFVTMPAKAAGTSMKMFNNKCMVDFTIPDNVIRYKKTLEKLFTDNYDFPSILASHVVNDKPFIDLLKGSTRETLIVHIHREELSRAVSAIQYMLVKICIKDHDTGKLLREKYKFEVEMHENRCTIDEEHLISVIKGKDEEIGYGAAEILLTCNYFDAIEQNAPSNLVFVHYKQVNKLQRILAKYHCPHILKDLPFVENTASDKKIEYYVRLQADPSREVPYKEWIDKKQNVILWALDLKSDMDCQSKVIDMEDNLFSCPDEAMTLHHGVYQCISLSEE